MLRGSALLLFALLLSGCLTLSSRQVQVAESSPEAAFSLGNQLYADGKEEQGIEWIKRSADANHKPAQYALGLLYASELYSSGGRPEAEYYLRLASESGMHQASYKLAEYYRTGVIGEPDVPKAVLFYERAIDQGSMDARKALGVMYLRGIGVVKDEQKGRELIRVFQ